MKSLAILFLATTSFVFAQQATPTPKKDPFAGWGTALDQRPGDKKGSGKSQPSQSSQSDLPAPLEGKTYTLEDIDKAKFDLDGAIVRLRISPTIFKPEQISPQEFCVFVQDAANAGNGYGNIYFPREGLQKMDLLDKTARGSLTFYVRVTPKKLTAVGRSISKDIHAKVTYTW